MTPDPAIQRNILAARKLAQQRVRKMIAGELKPKEQCVKREGVRK